MAPDVLAGANDHNDPFDTGRPVGGRTSGRQRAHLIRLPAPLNRSGSSCGIGGRRAAGLACYYSLAPGTPVRLWRGIGCTATTPSLDVKLAGVGAVHRVGSAT